MVTLQEIVSKYFFYVQKINIFIMKILVQSQICSFTFFLFFISNNIVFREPSISRLFLGIIHFESYFVFVEVLISNSKDTE